MCTTRRLAVALLATLGACGGSSEPTAPPKPPAQVGTNDGFLTVALQPDAQRRLGIATTPMASRRVERRRTAAGELLLPLAREARGRSVFGLLPAMTASELIRVAELQVDADAAVAAAQVRLDAARIALGRAELLVDSKAGTRRGADEARTQVQLADAALHAAREKRALLGAPVFDAVRAGVLWVRVAVYAGDVEAIDRDAGVTLRPLGASAGARPVSARPVPIPLSAGTTAATVDLFYELQTGDASLRAGQRVSVELPLRESGDALVVPRAAVLYDVHGGSWVYVESSPRMFTRRRVEVRWMDDAGAVLARGPAAGTVVVTDGAAELFGVEFGAGK